MNSPTWFTILFIISTASPIVLTQKAKKLLFHITTLRVPPLFLYYVYKEWVTSADDFSVKEATFNLKLAVCMQKTCSNLNPWLPKHRSNALICDFYRRLSRVSRSHAHAHAKLLQWRSQVMLMSFARHTCMSRVCECILFWVTVWLNYHSWVHCSFWLLNHTLLKKIPALIVREYTTTINADITLKWKQRRNSGCLHETSINEVDCAVP